MLMQQFTGRAVTHPGTRRDYNEDAFVDRPDLGLWAVADGVGGHQAGDVASQMISSTLETIPASLTAEEMLSHARMRIGATHLALQQLAATKGEGMTVASTVVILIIRQEHFVCLWAGDSRAYLLRGGKLLRISRDHSLVQDLVDSGNLTEAEAVDHPRGNIITRAVGDASETLELDKVTGRTACGDRFLLCSDGLSKVLDDQRIAELLGDVAIEDATDKLITEALVRGTTDNVTAVTIGVTGP